MMPPRPAVATAQPATTSHRRCLAPSQPMASGRSSAASTGAWLPGGRAAARADRRGSAAHARPGRHPASAGPAPTPMAGVPRPAPGMPPVGRPITPVRRAHRPSGGSPRAGWRPAAAAAIRRWHRAGSRLVRACRVTQSGFARPAGADGAGRVSAGAGGRAPPLRCRPQPAARGDGAWTRPVRPRGPRQHRPSGATRWSSGRPLPAGAEEISLDRGTGCVARGRRWRRGPAARGALEGLARGHREDRLGSRPAARGDHHPRGAGAADQGPRGAMRLTTEPPARGPARMTTSGANCPKAYEPAEVEARWYRLWLERRLLPRRGHIRQAAVLPSSCRRPTSRASCTWATRSPPPRGHPHPLEADGGFNALWHARARTTPASPPRWWWSSELKTTRGKTRHDLGREEFLERVWEWKEQVRRRASASSTVPRRLAATGAASASPWTRSCSRGGARGRSSACTRRGSSTAAPAAHQLVPRAAAPRSPTSRSSTRSAKGELWHFALPGEGHGPGARRGHHAPGDDARRHRGGGAPGRRALQDLVGKTRACCRSSTARSRSSPTRAGGPGVRHRRGEGDPGARLQRLPDRPAAQPADDLHPRRRRRASTRTPARTPGWTASRRASRCSRTSTRRGCW